MDQQPAAPPSGGFSTPVSARPGVAGAVDPPVGAVMPRQQRHHRHVLPWECVVYVEDCKFRLRTVAMLA